MQIKLIIFFIYVFSTFAGETVEDQSKLALKLQSKKISTDILIVGEENEKKIDENLKNIDLILNKEKDPKNILRLKLNQVLSYIQLAKITRVMEGGGKISIKEREILQKANNILNVLLKNESYGPNVKSKIYYYLGIIFIDFGDNIKAKAVLDKCIELNPNAPYVPSISIYLADLYYENKKLNEALLEYKKFYAAMKPNERDLADYKIGWIYLNQSMLDEAFNQFEKIIKNSKSTSMIDDAIMSLALGLTEVFDQEKTLEKINNAHFPVDLKMKVEWQVFDRVVENPKVNSDKLFHDLIANEKNPQSMLHILNILLERAIKTKELREEGQLKIEEAYSYYKKNQKEILSVEGAQILYLGAQLEKVIAILNRNFNQTKSDHHKKLLLNYIDLYLQVPKFEHRVEVATLKLDFLYEIKDLENLFNYSKVVMDDSSLNSIFEKANLLYLEMLDGLYRLNKNKYKESYKVELLKFVKNSKSNQREVIYSRLIDLYLEMKDFKNAEESLYEIFSDPTTNTENRSRYILKLVALNYESGSCDKVTSLVEKHKNENPEIVNYLLECVHKEALLISNEPSKINSYKEKMYKYITYVKENQKEYVIAEYLTAVYKMVQGNVKLPVNFENNEEFYQSELSHFSEFKFKKTLFPLYQAEYFKYLELAEFKKAIEILSSCPENKICSDFLNSYNNMKLLLEYQDFKNIDFSKYSTFSSEIKNYLIIAYPDDLFELFDKNLGKKTDWERFLLSSRILGKNFNDKKYIPYALELQKNLNIKERPSYLTEVIKLIEKCDMAAWLKKSKVKDEDILTLIRRVQKIRKIIVKELPSYNEITRNEILKAGIKIENQMGELILKSPVPNDLPPDKIAEYKKGLSSLAEEFLKQSMIFKEILENKETTRLSEKTKNEQYEKVKNYFSTYNLKDEKEISAKYLGNVAKLDKVKALFYLDFLLGLKKITAIQYFKIKVGILFQDAIKYNYFEGFYQNIMIDEANSLQINLEQFLEVTKK